MKRQAKENICALHFYEKKTRIPKFISHVPSDTKHKNNIVVFRCIFKSYYNINFIFNISICLQNCIFVTVQEKNYYFREDQTCHENK